MNRIVNIFSESFRPLPIYFHSIDNYHIQESVRSPKGKQYFHQIMFIVDGTGILNCRGETYPLKNGSAFFLEASVPHEYTNTGGLVSAYVAVCGEAVESMLGHFECDGFLYYESVELVEYLADITEMINEYNGKKRASVISSMLYTFYMKFFEQDRESKLLPLDKTVLYLEKNHAKKLSIKKLASINGTSVSKFCRDFKTRFGCTAFEYLVDYRLNTARSLIRLDPILRTKDVAISVGFDDISYFCRAYKKKFGVTPSEDRYKPDDDKEESVLK